MVVAGKILKGTFVPNEPLPVADGTPARLLIEDETTASACGTAEAAEAWDPERLKEWHELAELVQQERDADGALNEDEEEKA